jgi:hypothetical protein
MKITTSATTKPTAESRVQEAESATKLLETHISHFKWGFSVLKLVGSMRRKEWCVFLVFVSKPLKKVNGV